MKSAGMPTCCSDVSAASQVRKAGKSVRIEVAALQTVGPARLLSLGLRRLEVVAGPHQVEHLTVRPAAFDDDAHGREESEGRHVHPIGPIAPVARLVDQGLADIE